MGVGVIMSVGVSVIVGGGVGGWVGGCAVCVCVMLDGLDMVASAGWRMTRARRSPGGDERERERERDSNCAECAPGEYAGRVVKDRFAFEEAIFFAFHSIFFASTEYFGRVVKKRRGSNERIASVRVRLFYAVMMMMMMMMMMMIIIRIYYYYILLYILLSLNNIV